MFHYNAQNDLYNLYPSGALNAADSFMVVMIMEIFLSFLIVSCYLV